MKPFVPKIIFSDFDGTLTEGHRMSRLFFDTLDLCEKHEIPFVVVTGRSVQWAYFTLTHFSWPTHYIAEGGGVWVKRTPKHDLETHLMISQDEKKHLERVTDELVQGFSIPVSADSSGRLSDRAIELHEFERKKGLQKEVEIFLSSQGINYSCSNVHMNFWAGELSKSKAMTEILKAQFPEIKEDEALFFGDSLNDESVFRDFSHTVGVSNISKVKEQLGHHPALILEGSENEGIKGVYSLLSDWLK